jgi:hypothetical protein
MTIIAVISLSLFAVSSFAAPPAASVESTTTNTAEYRYIGLSAHQSDGSFEAEYGITSLWFPFDEEEGI